MLLNFKSRHSRLSLIKNSIISLSSVYFNSLIARLNLGAFEEFRIEEANKCGGYLLARGLSHCWEQSWFDDAGLSMGLNQRTFHNHES